MLLCVITVCRSVATFVLTLHLAFIHTSTPRIVLSSAAAVALEPRLIVQSTSVSVAFSCPFRLLRRHVLCLFIASFASTFIAVSLSAMLRLSLLRPGVQRSLTRGLASTKPSNGKPFRFRLLHSTQLSLASTPSTSHATFAPTTATADSAPSESNLSGASATALSQSTIPTGIRRRTRTRKVAAPPAGSPPPPPPAPVHEPRAAAASSPTTPEPFVESEDGLAAPVASLYHATPTSDAVTLPTVLPLKARPAAASAASPSVASSPPSQSSSRFQPGSAQSSTESFTRFSPAPSSLPELSQADSLFSPPSPTTAAYTSLPPHESTYVSHHYHIDMDDVHAYLRRKQLLYRESADHSQIVIRDCPFCHPINGKLDNQYKLTIYMPAANHYCHRCRAKGSWYDMKKRLGDIRDTVTTLRDQPITPHYTKGFPAFKQPADSASAAEGVGVSSRRHRQPTQSSMATYHEQLSEFPSVVSWLTEGEESGGRGLRRDLLDFYKVGAGRFKFISEEGKWVEEDCVTFPWMRVKEERTRRKLTKTAEGVDDTRTDEISASEERREQETTTTNSSTAEAVSTDSLSSTASTPSYIIDRIKYRSRVSKNHQRLLPVGGNWGFFGYHTIPASATSVILTEGEFDAIAAYQCTGVPAISLPNGANNLPVELLPFLERFSVIYLWMDDDRVGQEGAETFAKKLGINRCWIVRTRGGQPDGPKDANDALLQGYDLCDILAAAQPLPHRQITTFEELRDDVWKEIADPQQRAGVQSTSLPTLNSTLKGHRRGELTIITGSTGVGKVGLALQHSLSHQLLLAHIS